MSLVRVVLPGRGLTRRDGIVGSGDLVLLGLPVYD